MLKETPAQWVKHLENPNGWWRDTAQKLLILKGDTTVAGTLKQLVATHDNYLTRMHALWTLEGLAELDDSVMRIAMTDQHPQVRSAAIRASESLLKTGDDSLAGDIEKMAQDKNGEVVLQALMTAKHLRMEGWQEWLASAQAENDSRAVQELAPQLARGGPAPIRPTFTAAQRKVLKKGRHLQDAVLQLPRHGRTRAPGRRQKRRQARRVVRKQPHDLGHPDMSINVVLHGLTGPVDGKTYPNQMIPMKSYDDEWIASVLSYVRNNFGNRASFITPSQVAATRKATASREQPWTIDKLRAAVPQYFPDRKKWKFTASHNTGKAPAAVDGNAGSRFDTGTAMVPGMWFTIELPKAAEERVAAG